MKTLLVIAGIFVATPAWSQTKVYTNADLGRPLSSNRGTVTPEQLASLEAYQFRVPRTYDGPMALSSGLSPTGGPFGDVQNTIVPRRLDGSLWTEPQWQVSYLPGFYPYYSGYYPPYVPWPGSAGDPGRRFPERHPPEAHRRSAFRPGRR